jgi:GH25 family lysozyme M1 (1,4-beta-N-acetylmuramidase)
VLISVGLVIAIAVRTAASAPAALAASTAALVSLPASLPVPDGTDVSSANGSSINLAGVAGSMRFAAVKATEGDYYTDPDYSTDVTKAAAAGLYVMPYVFANPYPGNGTGTAQADYAWNKEIGKVTDPAYRSSARMLPVAVDLEPDPYAAQEKNGNQCYDLSPASMVTWIGDFISAAKADSGKIPVIYTTTAWWDACTADSKAFSGDPLWIASYGVTVPAIPRPGPAWRCGSTRRAAPSAGSAERPTSTPPTSTPLARRRPGSSIRPSPRSRSRR